MVIDRGDQLRLPQHPGRRIDQLDAADDVELQSCIGAGRSHRTNESFGRFRGRDRSKPCRCSIRSMVRSEGTTGVPLDQAAGLRSISRRIRRDPHRGCFRRISATATSTSSETWAGDERGRCERSACPASCSARHHATLQRSARN